MLSPSRARRAGFVSTCIANGALYAAHCASLQTPAAALLLAGSLFRCFTLPFTVYGDQCLHRVAGALPELQDAYKAYLDIADHPRAITWEKRVASQKLKNDRERIFRSHRTNNVKMTAPYAVGAALSVYCLGVPAQQMGTFFVQEAGMPIVSPLALLYTTGGQWALASGSSSSSSAAAAVLFAVDPTLALAAGLTCFNTLRHLDQRVGFNDRLDDWIATTKRCVCASLGILAAGSLLAGPLAYATALPALSFFPPYLAPVWLGMSATTAVKTALVNGTAPGRALCRLPAYPPQHGTYGQESTAAGHEYRLAFTGVDVEESRDVWQTQKRILDYECDVRLHRLLRQIGLFDDVDEITYEAEKLERKRAVVRERRRHGSAGDPHVSEEATSSEYVATQMERSQQQEVEKRSARKAAREAAWQRRH